MDRMAAPFVRSVRPELLNSSDAKRRKRAAAVEWVVVCEPDVGSATVCGVAQFVSARPLPSHAERGQMLHWQGNALLGKLCDSEWVQLVVGEHIQCSLPFAVDHAMVAGQLQPVSTFTNESFARITTGQHLFGARQRIADVLGRAQRKLRLMLLPSALAARVLSSGCDVIAPIMYAMSLGLHMLPPAPLPNVGGVDDRRDDDDDTDVDGGEGCSDGDDVRQTGARRNQYDVMQRLAALQLSFLVKDKSSLPQVCLHAAALTLPRDQASAVGERIIDKSIDVPGKSVLQRDHIRLDGLLMKWNRRLMDVRPAYIRTACFLMPDSSPQARRLYFLVRQDDMLCDTRVVPNAANALTAIDTESNPLPCTVFGKDNATTSNKFAKVRHLGMLNNGAKHIDTWRMQVKGYTGDQGDAAFSTTLPCFTLAHARALASARTRAHKSTPAAPHANRRRPHSTPHRPPRTTHITHTRREKACVCPGGARRSSCSENENCSR